MQSADVVGEQTTDVSPGSASADEIEFLISIEIVDDGMLINRGRIAAGGIGDLDVGYACNYSPYAPGCAIGGGKTAVEENSLFTQLVKMRSCVQGITPH